MGLRLSLACILAFGASPGVSADDAAAPDALMRAYSDQIEIHFRLRKVQAKLDEAHGWLLLSQELVTIPGFDLELVDIRVRQVQQVARHSAVQIRQIYHDCKKIHEELVSKKAPEQHHEFFAERLCQSLAELKDPRRGFFTEALKATSELRGVLAKNEKPAAGAFKSAIARLNEIRELLGVVVNESGPVSRLGVELEYIYYRHRREIERLQDYYRDLMRLGAFRGFAEKKHR
jgi:hypothetical protein